MTKVIRHRILHGFFFVKGLDLWRNWSGFQRVRCGFFKGLGSVIFLRGSNPGFFKFGSRSSIESDPDFSIGSKPFSVLVGSEYS